MEDILVEIPVENLKNLANLYEKHVEWAPHVLSMIHTVERWKQSPKFHERVRFMSPRSDSHGTIVVLMTFHCYDIFVFTLEESCTTLRKALTRTNHLDFNNPKAVFFCLHQKHIDCISEVLKKRNLRMPTSKGNFYMYSLPPPFTEAVSCPTEVYVKKLDPTLADQINSKWPHRFPGSRDYLSQLIEMNGGYGLFLRSTEEMVSWVVKHCFGHIGMLQTEEGHKKKGYAAVVTTALVREILEEGHYPFATIYEENVASISLFEKLGFKRIGSCTYMLITQ